MASFKNAEMRFLDEVLGMQSGYVLDFSNRTFSEFFDGELGLDIDDPVYSERGSSKANRLRCFLNRVESGTAARALRALWDYRMTIMHKHTEREDTDAVRQRYFAIVTRLESDSTLPRTDGIDRFERDPTLDELVAAIERDVAVNKPEVALDRLHTYCMKKFAHLLRQAGLEVHDKDTLNGRAGRLFNPLRASGKVRPISSKIMRTTVEVFELFNSIRNDESLAHDNELVDTAEARYIFDSVTSLLRFLKAIEGDAFGA